MADGAAWAGSAVTGICTLVAMGLTQWNARRQREDDRKHEDSVRFHEQRLEAYAALNRATSNLFATAGVWAEGSVRDSLLAYITKGLEQFNLAVERTSLLAGADVARHLRDLHRLAMSCATATTAAQVREVREKVTAVSVALSEAMKKELRLS